MIHEFKTEKCFGLATTSTRNSLIKHVAVYENLILLYTQEDYCLKKRDSM